MYAKVKHHEVQELLKMTFTAEKKYYEAAEEVQIVALSRFLNHQSVERNKHANELVEALTFNEIKPDITYIRKGKIHRKGLDIKLSLENSKYIPIVCKCLDHDQDLIDQCILVLENETIPIDILEITTRLMTLLIFEGIEGTHIIEELNKEKRKHHHPKVLQLKKNFV
ncbi:DUF2383 domain-containing protein [Aquimarina sp. U1-2]|uniref:DUF2383 domain-containing protein n=1 Tax=Aquimarina sp. U1-2 TaxID=2823141 RepID=UPI001AEC89C8|nr:DUF2383 domain-containing protein [Aquimarina sp. U1-2]MBP2830728.1 DUF2383 domain-containing protein [Aquimarina sp. U1-2]